MTVKTVLLELLLSGFFAVACMRACLPDAAQAKAFAEVRTSILLRFPGRLERLRRSRWQWFAMVALMLVLRLQQQLPPVLEWMSAVQFLLFVAMPTRSREARHDAALV